VEQELQLLFQMVKNILAYAKADDGTNPNIVSVEFGGDVVDDTSPQLGGDLDTNHTIFYRRCSF
jgi:hypothetical protein